MCSLGPGRSTMGFCLATMPDMRHGENWVSSAPLFLRLGLIAATLMIVASSSTVLAQGLDTGTRLESSGDYLERIVPFVPTPLEVVEKMLEVAQVTPNDVVYDLGSGDGRIVIMAA